MLVDGKWVFGVDGGRGEVWRAEVREGRQSDAERGS